VGACRCQWGEEPQQGDQTGPSHHEPVVVHLGEAWEAPLREVTDPRLLMETGPHLQLEADPRLQLEADLRLLLEADPRPHPRATIYLRRAGQ